MTMTDRQREELEAIARAVVTETELQVTKDVHQLERVLVERMGKMWGAVQRLPQEFTSQLAAYDEKQTARRRWMFRTMLLLAGSMISLCGFLAAYWPH